MCRNIFCILVAGVLVLSFIPSVPAVNVPLTKDEIFSTINLPIPKNPDERKYLGLSSGAGNFKIPKIKANVVFIEIFSMYCLYCQNDAPKINELYHMVGNNPDLKNKIKMIGIGAGNTSFEVETFKKKFAVPFPLFPDEDFAIHKLFGEPRTPYFIVIRINANGTYQVVHSQLGDFQGAKPFLELILKTSKLK